MGMNIDHASHQNRYQSSMRQAIQSLHAWPGPGQRNSSSQSSQSGQTMSPNHNQSESKTVDDHKVNMDIDNPNQGNSNQASQTYSFGNTFNNDNNINSNINPNHNRGPRYTNPGTLRPNQANSFSFSSNSLNSNPYTNPDQFVGKSHSDVEIDAAFSLYVEQGKIYKEPGSGSNKYEWKCKINGCRSWQQMSYKSAAWSHVWRLHLNGSYICKHPDCVQLGPGGYKSKNRTFVTQHIRYDHFEEPKPYKCPLCFDYFIRWADMRMHITQTKYKTYKMRKDEMCLMFDIPATTKAEEERRQKFKNDAFANKKDEFENQ